MSTTPLIVWSQLLGRAYATSVIAGTDGAVYIAGQTWINLDGQTNNGGSDAFITLYNQDGIKGWTQLLGGKGDDYATSLTTGTDGAIYVAGMTQTNNSGLQAFITRYNQDGSKAWTHIEQGIVCGLTIGADGAIYGAGMTGADFNGQPNNGGLITASLTRLNTDGSREWWTQLLFGTGAQNAFAVTTGADGAIYVSGLTRGNLNGQSNSGNGDSFIIKLFDPVNNHAPTGGVKVNGVIKLGQTLTATNTLADADGLGVINYQWRADGVNLVGATTSILTLTQSLLQKPLSVVASYMDVAGNLETVISNTYYSNAVAENSKLVTTIVATDALLGAAPKFTLTGDDAWMFKISSKGVLTFAAVKDFEQREDANGDGIYEVSVTMTNAKTNYQVAQPLTLGVEFVPINGSVGADTLKGTAGYDTLDGMAGDDKLAGGAGLDTFLVTAGRDAVMDFNLLTKDATGSEILQVSAGATADATLKAAWIATADSFNDGVVNLTTKGMSVDLSGITHGQGWNVTNTGAATQITGSQFNDLLTGGTGNDQLSGGAGNDVLAGGKGADILTGGAGADTFRLSGDTKTDHITDFLSGTDRIELDNLVFKALLTEGQLSATQFAQGTAATTATQRIVYDQPTGNLWYDADGSGKGKAVLMAVLDNHVQIAHTDFWIV